MERFRKFADETTGEHPFLPVKSSRTWAQTAKSLAFLPLKLLLKAWLTLALVTLLVERFAPAAARLLFNLQQKLLFLAFSVKVREDSGREAGSRREFVLANLVLAQFSSTVYLKAR